MYKLRIRESEKLKTVLELCDLEIHQKKIGPDYHRLKTMVKRSIEQDIRNRNVGTRNGNHERNAVVKNPGKNSVTKEFLEIVGDGKPTGSVLEETIAVSVTISIAMLKKNDLHESVWQPVVNRDKSHDRPGRPDVKRDTPVMSRITDLLGADHRIHDNWVVSFKT